jgi:hypothetical protein
VDWSPLFPGQSWLVGLRLLVHPSLSQLDWSWAADWVIELWQERWELVEQALQRVPQLFALPAGP